MNKKTGKWKMVRLIKPNNFFENNYPYSEKN